MSKPLRLESYQAHWKTDFNKIKTYLMSVITNSSITIYHVGSTSVVGMVAKPIIDIDIAYDNGFTEIKEDLEQHHYLFEGEKGIKGRYSLRYQRDDLPEHHLYLMHKTCDELKRHLTFKRALLRSKKHRDEYSALKQQLVAVNHLDRVLYTESKTTLVNQIMMEERSMKSIVFAGGCFWGVEAYFKQLEGVTNTEVGYINGDGNATYEEVCRGSGHAEAVLIRYDEAVISLKKLLDHLFNIIDPTSINKQGNDIGVQYRTGIYNYAEEELFFIENYILVRQKEYNKPIVLEVETDLAFYPAEDYHQDYLEKNKHGYCHIDLTSYKNIK